MGAGQSPDNVLFRLPLITIDGTGVYYDQIAPTYDRGEIERPRSPHDMEPRIALAFDYALLIIARERKWTWVISGRYLRRLPWGHPCKMTPEGRPGWPLLTDMLEYAGYIERRTGQTWRLSVSGRTIAKGLQDLWQSRAQYVIRTPEASNPGSLAGTIVRTGDCGRRHRRLCQGRAWAGTQLSQ